MSHGAASTPSARTATILVVAVLSYGTAAHVSTATIDESLLMNLAIDRPCSPLPACTLLIDGRISANDAQSLTSSGGGEAGVLTRTFNVALPPNTYVDRIVVHCVAQSGALRGSEHGRHSNEHIHVGLLADAVSKDDSTQEATSGSHASQLEDFVATPLVSDERGGFRLEIPIASIASGISLEVRPPETMGGSNLVSWLSRHKSLCGGKLPATEVSVLGREPLQAKEPQAPLVSGPAVTTMLGAKNIAHTTGGSAAPPRRQNVNIAMSTLEEHLPSTQLRVDAEETQRPAARAILSEAIVPAVAAWVSWYTVSLLLGLVTLTVVSIRRAAKVEAYSEMQQSQSQSSPPAVTGPAFFYIGDHDDEEGLLGQSLAAAHCIALSASEPEPEAELDPPSLPGTPIHTPRTHHCKSLLTCPGTQLREIQPAPFEERSTTSNASAARAQLQLPALNVVANAPHGSQPATIDWPLAVPTLMRRRQRCEKHVVMLFSAPLCYADPNFGMRPLPQPAFDNEWRVMLQARAEALAACQTRGTRDRKAHPVASLSARPLTAANLQRILAPSSAGAVTSVLHLSAHGTGDSIVLENGKRPCTAHPLSCDQLSAMLSLRKASAAAEQLQLVVLNACNSKATGLRFAQNGVPHVLCTTDSIKDSWSQLFLHKFYSCLFQGDSVISAFQAALVTVCSDPEIPSGVADAFCLLPNGVSHNEVLFPVDPQLAAAKETSISADSNDTDGMADDADRESHSRVKKSKRDCIPSASITPFDRCVPLLPEDFIGRSLDVWTVLQHLVGRRIVVVCGGDSASKGIGKSTVMDAVQRALMLQLGATCVAVEFQGRAHTCSSSDANGLVCRCWMSQIKEAIHKTMAELGCGDTVGVSRRCIKSRRCLPGARSRIHSEDNSEHSSPTCPSCMAGASPMDTMLESLVADMQSLARLSSERRFGGEWWPATSANGPFAGGPSAGESGGALLLLHDCDHLVEQQYFQEAMSAILRRCPGYRVLLGTQGQVNVPGSSWCQFKVVHHVLQGLAPMDSARLFLRRAHRAIHWEELLPPEEAMGQRNDVHGPVCVTKQNEMEVLRLVSQNHAVAAQGGNPQAVIELANKVNHSLANLRDLSTSSLVAQSPLSAASTIALAPPQGIMTPCTSTCSTSRGGIEAVPEL